MFPANAPIIARFWALAEMPSAEITAPELQIRPRSRESIETYTERHTIVVMSEVSAARGVP